MVIQNVEAQIKTVASALNSANLKGTFTMEESMTVGAAFNVIISAIADQKKEIEGLNTLIAESAKQDTEKAPATATS